MKLFSMKEFSNNIVLINKDKSAYNPNHTSEIFNQHFANVGEELLEDKSLSFFKNVITPKLYSF